MKKLNYKKIELLAIPAAIAAILVSASAFSAHENAPEEHEPALSSLGSLEDLLRTEVRSVSRRPERLGDAAAAVYVISSSDIAKSGVRTVPEALRLAPGVNATRISANRWAITIRGGADRLSNKLLVLVDGRNAYSPAFSGVFWESMQMPMEDIERIEVIRGPGAAVWGTNAVNGVINIISKSAASTQGLSVKAGGGDREGWFANVSAGSKIEGTNIHQRTYVNTQQARAFETQNGESAKDHFETVAAGLRLDGFLRSGARWNANIEYQDIESQTSTVVPVPNPPFNQTLNAPQKLQGFQMRGRMVSTLENRGELEVQAAYAYSDITFPALGNEERNTIDVDVQYRPETVGIHRISIGAGVRHSRDNFEDGEQQFFADNGDAFSVFSLYAEDVISLTDTLTTTIGLRLDEHDYTGLEFQPTLRALWNASTNQTVWASVSRAVRTPSRGERNFNFVAAYVPTGFPAPAPVSIPIILQGTDNFDSEVLIASELGYRAQVTPKLFGDLTAYLHQYEDLRSFAFTSQTTGELGNTGELDLYGVELTGSWRPMSGWLVNVNYSYSEVLAEKNQADEAAAVPRHIGSVRVSWDILSNLGLDVTGYRLSSRKLLGGSEIDAFTSLNAALRWQESPNVELRLVGQDLLNSNQFEGSASVPRRDAVYVPRGIYGQIRVNY